MKKVKIQTKSRVSTKNKISVGHKIALSMLIISAFSLGLNFAGLAFNLPSRIDTKKVEVTKLTSLNIYPTIEAEAYQIQEAPLFDLSTRSISTPKSAARRIYVDNSAEGANDGTSWKDAYTTLYAALQDLENEAGVTIEVAAGDGIYYEDSGNEYRYIIGGDDSGIDGYPNTIIAKKGETPVLEATNVNNMFFIEGEHMIISGFSFLSYPYVRNSNHIVLENNIMTDPISNGMRIGFSEKITLRKNTINRALNGITIWASDFNIIESNSLFGNGCTAINLSGSDTTGFSDENIIINNIISNTGKTGEECGVNNEEWGGNGIRLNYGSSNNTIKSNTIDTTKFGYYNGGKVNGNGILILDQSNNNILENNNITNSGIGGIKVINSTGNITAYSNLWNNNINYNGIKYGAGDISVNPRYIYPFVEGKTANYHLGKESSAIDAGNPSSNYSKEPQPNGNRINIGAYGNTNEATPSLRITPERTYIEYQIQ